MFNLKSTRRLISSESGGIVVVFAFLLVPMMVFTAFAVDMTRVMTNRIIMQNIADQAILDILNLRVQEGWTKFRDDKRACAGSVNTPCDAGKVKEFYISRALQTGHRLGGGGSVQAGDESVKIGVTDGNYDIDIDKAEVEVTQVVKTFFAPISSSDFANITIKTRSSGQLSPVVIAILADVSWSMKEKCPEGILKKIEVLQKSICSGVGCKDGGFVTMFNPNPGRDAISLTTFGTIAGVRVSLGENIAGGLSGVVNGDNGFANIPLDRGSQTNFADAFRLAYADFRGNKQGILGSYSKNKALDVVWVVFSDGAPTAGVFNFVESESLEKYWATGDAPKSSINRLVLSYKQSLQSASSGDSVQDAIFQPRTTPISSNPMTEPPFSERIDIPSRFYVSTKPADSLPPDEDWEIFDIKNPNCVPGRGTCYILNHGLFDGGVSIESTQTPLGVNEHLENLEQCLNWDRNPTIDNQLRKQVEEFTDSVMFYVMARRKSGNRGNLLDCLQRRDRDVVISGSYITAINDNKEPRDCLSATTGMVVTGGEGGVCYVDDSFTPGTLSGPLSGVGLSGNTSNGYKCGTSYYGTCYLPDMSFCVPFKNAENKVCLDAKRINELGVNSPAGDGEAVGGGSKNFFLKAYYHVALAWAHYVRSLAGTDGVRSSRIYAVGVGTYQYTNSRYTFGDDNRLVPNNVMHTGATADGVGDNDLFQDVWNQDARKDYFLSQLANDYATDPQKYVFPVGTQANLNLSELNCRKEGISKEESSKNNVNGKTCGEAHPIGCSNELIYTTFTNIARKIQMSLIQ